MSTQAPLYNTIGDGYNTTRRPDPFITERLFSLLSPVPNKLYLDIGCGTGNYTTKLAERGVRLYGVDPSETMLHEARIKSAAVTWLTGTAEHIPVDNSTFSGALATLTLHHWNNLGAAFLELARVLQPDGTLVVLTATPEQMQGYWLCHYFPIMMQASVEYMPSFSRIEQAAADAGFAITKTEQYTVHSGLQDLFLYAGKHNPKLYFEAAVRQGISSFASLSHADEVEHGLAKLRADIDSGVFAEVAQRYANDRGDYLFIVFQKNPNVGGGGALTPQRR